MGVASPLQSGKPVEYWLGGLTTSELVHLWEFLAGNQRSKDYEPDRDVFKIPVQTGDEVRKHLYSESMPSSFYACKDRGGLRPSDRGKPGLGVGLYKHRKARDPQVK